MRIQHNIMSMNAYRNYNNNASALSKNLEKLSSGYKINRAGDDAAGLAISEKMRAQIKGLEAAQKNVKDGISLVKTAEGAMQEIQDMLSRMKYLATQSSNGTYDDEVDRKALQDEVDQLNSEINRIADSANFNGTKLLDGSLGGGAGANGSPASVDLTAGCAATKQAAVKGEYKNPTAFADAAVKIGDTFSITLNMEKADGTIEAVKMDFTVAADAAGEAKTLIAEDGTEITLAAKDKVAAGDYANILSEITKNKTVSDNFDVANAAGVLTFTSKEAGASQMKIKGIEVGVTSGGKYTGVSTTMNTTKAPMDEYYTADLSTAKIWDGKEDTLKDSTMTIGGEKFVFVNKGALTADALKRLQKDGTAHYVEVGTKDAVDATDIKAMVEKMNLAGLNVEQGEQPAGGEWTKDATKTQIAILADQMNAGGGLQLQIGDTSDNFNQLMVTVGDLHADAIGVGSVDISSIDGATKAIDSIKNAINTVSAIRGKLGATQNRLEHTANNLSVMTENIQDAESTIRDTDVADEMMAYTKNNILIQSAQAMLAQANAVPQGVLQLLQ